MEISNIDSLQLDPTELGEIFPQKFSYPGQPEELAKSLGLDVELGRPWILHTD